MRKNEGGDFVVGSYWRDNIQDIGVYRVVGKRKNAAGHWASEVEWFDGGVAE